MQREKNRISGHHEKHELHESRNSENAWIGVGQLACERSEEGAESTLFRRLHDITA